MTRTQELYRVIDINRAAIILLQVDKKKIEDRIYERVCEIKKAQKELDELCQT